MTPRFFEVSRQELDRIPLRELPRGEPARFLWHCYQTFCAQVPSVRRDNLLLLWSRDYAAHVTLDEGDRQMVILALALCGLARPGFADACARIAAQFPPSGDALFAEFTRFNRT